jgi:hypothetical protein
MSSTYVATKMGLRAKPTMDERYTKPQGLYTHGDVDLRKLKKLIVSGKLAPCYPGQEGGDDDDARVSAPATSAPAPAAVVSSGASVGKGAYEAAGYGDVKLDECPICFLNYPSLNHSRCCKSVICTECFLQVKVGRYKPFYLSSETVLPIK